MASKPVLNYYRQRTYNNTASNVIGASASALRVVPANSNTNTLYVRGYGAGDGDEKIVYPKITSLTSLTIDTPRTTGISVAQWTLYGGGTGMREALEEAGAQEQDNFLSDYAGGSGSTRYFEIECYAWDDPASTITVVEGDTLTLVSSGGSFKIYLPGFSLAAGESIKFFIGGVEPLNHTVSNNPDQYTYYDGILSYPTYTPDGTEENPYLTVQDADDNVAGAKVQIGILDDNIYDEDIIISNAEQVFAVDGKTPEITRGVGARSTRKASTIYTDSTALYWNENGDDGNSGSWADPFETAAAAISARTTEHIVYGGVGAANGIIEINADISIDAFNFEADSYLMPILKFTTDNQFILGGTSANNYLGGFIIDANYISTAPINILKTSNVEDCTIRNTYDEIEATAAINIGLDVDSTVTIKRNKIYNCGSGIFSDNDTVTMTVDWQYNEIYSNQYNGIEVTAAGGSDYILGSIKNNKIYSNDEGILITAVTLATAAGILKLNNNIVVKNSFGISFASVVQTNTLTAEINNNIVSYNATGIYSDSNITIKNTALYSNSTIDLAEDSATITNTDPITTDPKLCKTTEPYVLGLQPDSPCIRGGEDGEDVGANLKIMVVNNDPCVVNGIYFNGQNFYNEGVKITEDNIDIKWCTFYNFHGMGLDAGVDDSGGTRINSEILNNKFFDNGAGIFGKQQSLLCEYNLFYSLTGLTLYINSGNATYNHNVYTLAGKAIYIGSGTGLIYIKNSIIVNNSIGVESDIILDSSQFTYNCFTDSISVNIDTSDTTNINRDPLFIDPVTVGDNKNLNIKTVEAGANSTPPIIWPDSPAKNSGESDIGAYQFSSRGISEEWWQSFPLLFNPEFVNQQVIGKSIINNQNAQGSISLFGLNHRRVWPFIWTANRYTTEIQRLTLEYMNTLIQTRENGLTKDETIFRVNETPDTAIESGTSATVDASNYTLTDSNKSWIPFQLKGYHAGIKFKTGTALVISKSGKTATKASEFTGEDWTGYYITINNIQFYIKSNTDNALTLSDPDGYLTDQTLSIYSIQKYFKIRKNTKTILTLRDIESELSSGTYSYDVYFGEGRLQKSDSAFIQNRYAPLREYSKSGGELIIEECDG